MKKSFLTSEKAANALAKMRLSACTLEELELTETEMEELISATGNIHYNNSKKRYYITQFNENNYEVISLLSKKEVTERWLEISDIYFGSKFCNYTNLVAALDEARARNITNIHIAGDLCAGHPKFKKQALYLTASTAQEQANMAIKLFSKYPEFKYYCVNGERDLSFEKGDSINPIILVQRGLNEKDIEFHHINEMVGNLVIDGVIKRIQHGTGKPAYTKSYNIEKEMKKIFEKGDNVTINDREYNIRFVQFGHFHSDCYQRIGGINITSTAGMVFDDLGILDENTTYPSARINETVIKNGKILSFSTDSISTPIKVKR